MDIYNEELLSFWRSLERCKVRYIMVGGVATNLHGYQRTTEDIDMWLADTLENRQNLRFAFNEYGIGDFEPLIRIQFVPGWTYFHLNNGLRLDIMVGMKGLEKYSFDESYEMASIATIADVNVPFIHINQLIQNKKAVNRPKDQIDVIYLEKIIEIQKKEADKKRAE
jgi:hypothetical protein